MLLRLLMKKKLKHLFSRDMISRLFSDGTNGYKFNRTNGDYFIFGKKGAYVQLPSIAGKALTKVVCVSRKSARVL